MDILLIISLAGAALYALSRSTLLLHLTIGPDVRGISLITQELYAVVYCCRYLELLAIYTGFLPTVAKIAKITIALAIVLLFRFGSYSKSYEAEHDTVPRWILLLPPFALALVYNRVAMFVEIFHQFSWYLEPLALIPQFVLMYRKQLAYEGWVMSFTFWTAVESVLQNVPLFMAFRESLIGEPYRLYAALVLVTVLFTGFLLLAFQRIAAKRRPATLNESANKPAFGDVWEASKFQFMNEDSSSAGASGAAAAGNPPGHVTAAGLSAVAGRGPAAV